MPDAAVVETPEQVRAAEVEADAAFSAGYDTAPADDAAPEASPVEGAEPVAAEAAPEVAAPVLIGGMTEEDWNAAVAKAAGPLVEQARAESRKNFGQIGDLNRTIQELKAQIAAGGSSASRKKLTAEALKRVNEELPGLGDALAQDLAEFLDSPAVQAEAEKAKDAAEAKGQTFDSEAFFAQKIGPALQDMEARANERAELRIVKTMHRDFETVVRSPEFAGWLGTLPPEEQTRIRESDDGFVAADAVTDFKAWREKAKQQKQNKQARLEGAIPAKGTAQTGHVSNDEDAEFERGFKAAH